MYIFGSTGNYCLTIAGKGFGEPTVTLPYTGDVSNFRIADEAQVGHGEWGYTGNANVLNYQAWSDTSITVCGLGASPGDAILPALWNASSGEGVTWGGNVPVHAQISSVSLSGSGENLKITVKGSGFGTAPVTMPFTGDLNYFRFFDFRTHCGAISSLFEAGFDGWGIQSPDAVTLKYRSWSDSRIVVSGFAGAYGTGCATYETGDPVLIVIYNTSDTSDTGSQTAWGNR